ncbi:TolC family protein [Algoriphagus sp. CAU 1675]|uniref:TolC family protein n=1 Tax=Algoriphagus sp. CAU 1675 TaxID=3032597 RepID=UPI0023DC1290|nr:TolC family protein [Algoriphagus sp. CAU 1675]MDF2157036.1 TolC family protein [Algoriphagus sp. CAU 1675]
MLRKYLFYAFASLIPGLAMAQNPMEENSSSDKVTLKESIEIGLKNNRNLQKALLDEKKAQYQRNEIRGAGLPQFSAYGNYNNFINVFPQAVPGGIFGGNPDEIQVIALGVPQSLKAGFQLNQLIYSNSYLIGLKAARTGEEFYRLLAQQSEEDVIYDIAANYLGTVQLHLQRENLLATIDQLKGLERILQAQYDNDLARKVDLNRVKVNLTAVRAELENLDIAIYQREGYLKLLMGMPVENPITLDLETDSLQGYLSSFNSLDFSAQDRKDLQILGVQKQLYEYEFKNIKSNHLPQLVGFADWNRNAFATQFDFLTDGKVWRQGFLIGLQLRVPIFDGLQTRNRAAQTKVKLAQLALDQSQAEQGAQLEYQSASNKYKNSVNTLVSLDKNLQLAEEVLKETNLLYKEGLSPLTDLLEAETTQRQAQTNYNNQLIQVQIAQLELLKSSGQIKNLIQN